MLTPGSGAFLTSGSGFRDGEKNPDPGSGIDIPDYFSESVEIVFWIKNTKTLAQPVPGSWIFLTRDGKIRIRNAGCNTWYVCSGGVPADGKPGRGGHAAERNLPRGSHCPRGGLQP